MLSAKHLYYAESISNLVTFRIKEKKIICELIQSFSKFMNLGHPAQMWKSSLKSVNCKDNYKEIVVLVYISKSCIILQLLTFILVNVLM